MAESKGKGKSKAEEYLEGWKRAQADLINYKKEEAQRFEQIIKFANEELIKSLLPVLDSFERAEAVWQSGSNNGREGLEKIKLQLESILKKKGLERLPSSLGQEFDPKIHEAVAVAKSSQEKAGVVVEELEAGYKLNGKLIRPAKVKVAG